jgi:hypothetical protein
MKDFVSPEIIRKAGGVNVAAYLRFLLAIVFEAGGRPVEIDVHGDQAVVQWRKEAAVPLKAVLHKAKTNERTTKKFQAQWTWVEGDWYLGEKGLVEEK